MINKEIVIVGAGPAGLTAALFLAKFGIPSTIFEKKEFPRDKVCGDALSGKVSWVLNKLNNNIYKEIVYSHHAKPSWGVKFYGAQNNELKVPFKLNYDTQSDTPPGFIAKRKDFDYFLYSLAKQKDKIQIIEDTTITNVARDNKQIILTTKKKNNYKADIVLAADGAYSNIAKQLMDMTISDKRNSLGLRAYYKNVKNLDSEGFIELHFLKHLVPGYFWIFPLSNGDANVGIGMPVANIKKSKINLKKLFDNIIGHHPDISKRFQDAIQIDKAKLHGLPFGGVSTMSADNLLLLGDAAGLIDPFTGEGIGHAMISGMIAAETIRDNYHQKNYGAITLKNYDNNINKRLKTEFNLSQIMQNLTAYPYLFNFVINKAKNNKELKDTISCMFENVDLRSKFKDPTFYLKLFFK